MAAWTALGIIAATLLALGAWDYALYLRGGTPATISFQLYALAQRHPIIPAVCGIVVGILFGHLFWK